MTGTVAVAGEALKAVQHKGKRSPPSANFASGRPPRMRVRTTLRYCVRVVTSLGEKSERVKRDHPPTSRPKSPVRKGSEAAAMQGIMIVAS
jgi:hypothetical protein